VQQEAELEEALAADARNETGHLGGVDEEALVVEEVEEQPPGEQGEHREDGEYATEGQEGEVAAGADADELEAMADAEGTPAAGAEVTETAEGDAGVGFDDQVRAWWYSLCASCACVGLGHGVVALLRSVRRGHNGVAENGQPFGILTPAPMQPILGGLVVACV